MNSEIKSEFKESSFPRENDLESDWVEKEIAFAEENIPKDLEQAKLQRKMKINWVEDEYSF